MIIRTVLLSALAMPTGLALAADAPFSDPSSLPKVSCDDIHYSEAFLQRYPKAPASCIEGRIYNGEKWAKFKAKVYLVKLPDFITVEMLDVAGNPVETFSLKPDPNDKIVLDAGKSMSFNEYVLEVGEALGCESNANEHRGVLAGAAAAEVAEVAWVIPGERQALSHGRAPGLVVGPWRSGRNPESFGAVVSGRSWGRFPPVDSVIQINVLCRPDLERGGERQ